MQDPRADRDDESRGFARRDEVVRLDDAALGMPPSKERLDTGEGAARKVDGWLVHQEELLAVESALEVDFQPTMVVDRFLHGGNELHGPSFPGRLRLVQRDVGVLE